MEGGGFTHLIIEKPFGKDSASFDELNQCTASLFKESELYRIDHYLGTAETPKMRRKSSFRSIFGLLWGDFG